MYTFAYLGMQQIIIILVLVLLIFGPQKVPEIGRQIGGALRDLKKMSNEVQQAFDIDEHLSYDRYEPPTYEYHPPVETTHTPLDQYGLVETEHPNPLIEGAVEDTHLSEATTVLAAEVPVETHSPISDVVVTEGTEKITETDPQKIAEVITTEKLESAAETPSAQGARK